ncbi:MAG: hypothetical protein P8N70_12975, partial [Akkermansiaceae bacterium]|nr:hypothetical protein [Akkermansiaceae bacterium]
AGSLTLTWRNTGAAFYLVKYSTNLTSFDSDITDGLTAAEDENPDDAGTITITFDLAAAGIIASDRLFVRVEAE